MRVTDVAAAQDVAYAAMDDLRAGGPTATSPATARRLPTPAGPSRTEAEVAHWRRRATHLLRHDPDGAWVAEDDGVLVGLAMALRRERLWGLSALFVRPGHQGGGIGGALLDAALAYSQGCLSGIVISTDDPRAARRYRLAGFTLYPTARARGVVDLEAAPPSSGIRRGGAGDRDLAESVDRRVRGASHGVDHEFLAAEYAMVVHDSLTATGYCYVAETGSPVVLAATSRRAAHQLLWAALRHSPPGAVVDVDFCTAEQQWAIDVALAARLTLRTEGYLCLRHLRPPAPYLPSAAFL